MQTRWTRVARGSAAAAFATFVALLSHVLAGGQAPSLFGIAASLVISAMLCTVLTSRALSVWRLATSIGLSQLLFHALFSSLGVPVAAAGHAHTLSLDAAAPHHAVDPAMTLAHVVAGFATLVVFRYGEAAFFGLADTARLFFARLLAVVVPVVVALPRRAVAVAVERAPAPLVLLSPMRHRGPPRQAVLA